MAALCALAACVAWAVAEDGAQRQEMLRAAMSERELARLVTTAERASMRAGAAYGIVQFYGYRGPETVGALVATLEDESPAVRLFACDSLGVLGADAHEAGGPLALLIAREHEPEVLCAMVGALSRIDRPPHQHTDSIRRLLLHEDEEVRLNAHSALVMAGEPPGPHIAALRAALADGTVNTRLTAIELLGGLGPASADAVPELLDCAREEGMVGWASISALGTIGARPHDVVPFLIETIVHGTLSTDVLAVMRARKAIRSTGGFARQSAQTVPVLLDVIRERRPGLAQAFHALGVLGAEGPAVWSAVGEVLAEGSAVVKAQGFEFLAGAGAPPDSFVSQARLALAGESEWTKEAAISYLSRVAFHENASDEAFSALIGASSGGSARARAAAVMALGTPRPDRLGVQVSALARALTDADYAVVRAALESVRNLGVAAEGILPELAALAEQYGGSQYEEWDQALGLKPLDEVIHEIMGEMKSGGRGGPGKADEPGSAE